MLGSGDRPASLDELKSQIRRNLPTSVVARIRRVVDVAGGIATEARWIPIRRRIAKSGLPETGLVIVHIHYPETWPGIAAKISRCIPDAPVVVTVSSAFDAQALQSVMPHAFVYRVPNRGRDVLPFLQVVRALSLSQNGWILKLHGKKSHHHRFGNEWMMSSLEALLPSPSVARECVERLSCGTPLIGPRGLFYSLSTHWAPNRAGLEAHTGKLDERTLGFFGGTMWWVRPDMLSGLPDWRSWHFPRERGQTDGTTAHIFERLVCLKPQIAGMTLASVDETGVRDATSIDPFPYDKL